MVELTELWLPILLSGLAVFFISFLMWMVMPHHKPDWVAMPDEDGFMKHLRDQGMKSPGQYTFPHCSEGAQMRDPEFLKKYSDGPKGFLILREEGPGNMGANLAKSFAFNVITAALVGYVATMAIQPGADSMFVFRFTSTVAFLANSMALVWGAVWFSRSWSSTLKEMFDGAVYAAATGALFMVFWPDLA